MQYIPNFWGFKKREIEICEGKETQAFILNYIIALMISSRDQNINIFDSKYHARLSISRLVKRFTWMGNEKIRHIVRALKTNGIIIVRYEFKGASEYTDNYYTLNDVLYKEYISELSQEYTKAPVELDIPPVESDGYPPSNPTPYNKIKNNKNLNKKEKDICHLEESPNKEATPPSTTSIPSPSEVLILFNEKVKDILPIAKTLSDKRKRGIISLTKKHLHTLQLWALYLDAILSSNFHTGGSKSGWRADIDFIIKESNCIKILEARFSTFKDAQTMDDWVPREIREQRAKENAVNGTVAYEKRTW